MTTNLQISFKELITDVPKILTQNLFCSLYLSEKSTFIFLSNITLNAPPYSLSDLTSKKGQKLQLRFLHKKNFLGSISLLVEDLIALSPMDFSQWFICYLIFRFYRRNILKLDDYYLIGSLYLKISMMIYLMVICVKMMRIFQKSE